MGGKTLKQCFEGNDTCLLVIAIAIAILSWVSVCNKLQIAGWISIAFVDIYLLSVLVLAAIRSDGVWNNNKIAKWFFPSRIAGLILVGMLLMVLIVGFAGIYCSLESGALHKEPKNTTDAIYFSFVTITTLGYGEIYPLLEYPKRIVIFQLISGTLLLFGIFPLLISRISSFTESVIDDSEPLSSAINEKLDLVKLDVDKLQGEKDTAQEEAKRLKEELAADKTKVGESSSAGTPMA